MIKSDQSGNLHFVEGVGNNFNDFMINNYFVIPFKN